MKTKIKNAFEKRGFFLEQDAIEKLVIYDRLLSKWQKAINLVSAATIDDVVERHFYDSAQVFRYITDIHCTLADMGSGAGFPGMVLAILGVNEVHLIESDVRKATFLREVSRETGIKVNIHDMRVEDCSIPNIDVFTARALAPLRDLLAHTQKLATPGHPFYCLFSKGEQFQEEVEKAKKRFKFEIEAFSSETDTSGKILKINKIENLY